MTSCPNCYRDYPDDNLTCEECGSDIPAPEKPDVPRAQIIDLFEALKQSLAPKGGES